MGLVLAIDPGRRQTQALERLVRDLEGHEVLVAASGSEALALLDGQVPDLWVFPLFGPSDEEARLKTRLAALPTRSDLRALTIPLDAFFSWEAHADPGASGAPRWFYWFKPATGSGVDVTHPRAFADAVRAELRRPRPETAAPAVQPPPPAAAWTEPTPAAPAWTASAPAAGTWDEPVAPVPPPELPQPRAQVAPPRERTPWRPPAIEPDVDSGVTGGWADHAPVSFDPSADEAGPGRAAAIAGGLNAGAARAAQAARTAGAASAAAAGAAFRTLSKLAAFAGPAAVDAARRVPPKGWIAAPVVAILLTLGVSGRITALVTSPVGLVRSLVAAWFPEKPKTGIGDIQSSPDGAQIWMNGRQIGVTPLRTEFAVGTHELELRYRGLSRTLTLDITPGSVVVQRLELSAPRLAGKLRVESDPSGALVAIDGKPAGVTPLSVDDLSVGKHSVDLTLRGNTAHESVDIRAAKTTTLRTSVYQGWLALFSPIEMKASADGRPLVLDDQNRVLLPAGNHQLNLRNTALGWEETRIVAIRPGDTTAVSVIPPKTSLTVTATGPAEVWIDGVRAGDVPIVDLPVDIGTREVVLRTPDRGSRKLTVTATVAPVRVAVDLAAPES